MTQPHFVVKMELKGVEDTLGPLRDPKTVSGPVTWGMQQSGQAVQREAKLRVPVDTGTLRNSIAVEVERRSPYPTWAKIGPRGAPGLGHEYGAYVEFGTGLYGPKKRVIRPVTKKALSWTTRSGKRIVRMWSSGMRPRPYMVPALPAAASRINAIWQEVGKRIVGSLARGK